MVESIRVLHVDDEPEFAEMAATLLEREDERFTIESATSVGDGLDRLVDEEYQCVISDYDMPGRDGIEFLEAVRETHPDIPFVLFTGKGSEEVASEAISAGATDYVRKQSGTGQYEILANRIDNAVSQAQNQRAERTLRELAETTDRIFYIFSREWGELEFINAAYEDILGRSAETLWEDPTDFLNGIHPDDRDRVREAMERLSGGEGVRLECRVNPHEDYQRWVGIRGEPIFDETGNVVRVAGFASEITEQKRRQCNLERYETIIQALADPIYGLDADGTYTFVNEAYVGQAGYTREEILGEHVSKLLPEEDIKRGREIIQDLLRDEHRHTATWEMTRITAEGEKIPTENHLALLPLDEDGEFRGTAGVVRDISERTKRERRLERQNERLEKFANVLAHDLRNPLNIAEGRLTLVSENCDSEHLDALSRALDRMTQLIDDVLLLAREGEEVTDPEPIKLNEIVEDSWHNVETPEAKLVVEADRMMRADRGRFGRLLENLFRNAVEHGGEDVTVTVSDFEDGIVVADDGPGIPAEERDRIFDYGYSTVDGGTGFGLSITQEIAEAHGWHIRAGKSEENGLRLIITGVEFTE